MIRLAPPSYPYIKLAWNRRSGSALPPLPPPEPIISGAYCPHAEPTPERRYLPWDCRISGFVSGCSRRGEGGRGHYHGADSHGAAKTWLEQDIRRVGSRVLLLYICLYICSFKQIPLSRAMAYTAHDVAFPRLSWSVFLLLVGTCATAEVRAPFF